MNLPKPPEKNSITKLLIQKFSNLLEIILYGQARQSAQQVEHTHHWASVMCLSGVDYFSSLAYQPGIALMAVGVLAPCASLLLVFLTLFGAVPTYIEISKRSYTGQGSIAMLETMLSGWSGKFIVLAMIAFAVTDFFITMTLSASDAAAHIVENPLLHSTFNGHQLSLALLLILLLGTVFYIGLKEAIFTAVVITIPYLLLTFIVIMRTGYEVYAHPQLTLTWRASPLWSLSPTALMFMSIVAFPKLALGLSGFETGVAVMPLISNAAGAVKSSDNGQTPQQTEVSIEQDVLSHDEHDKHAWTAVKQEPDFPKKRILGTKRLLILAALIMCFFLLTSSFITVILIDPKLAADGGEANGRALSYLTHLYLGHTVGSIYDLSTIVILWFAGASAMAGLLAILPRYLPRFGMAPKWLEGRKPLVVILTLIALWIVQIFDANVDAQSGAYATGVLALILSACIAVTMALWRDAKNHRWDPIHPKLYLKFKRKSAYFACISIVFLYTFLDNIRERPDGLIIASIFFVLIVIVSMTSRWFRAYELRVESHTFVDQRSKELFQSICNKKVDLIPISGNDRKWLFYKHNKIRQHYASHNTLAFLTINLRDDRSEFMAPLEIKVTQIKSNQEICYVIAVSGAVALANTIAYISEQIDPISIYLGLARKNAMEQAFLYLLFGEGEIGIVTYKVLVQYWETTPEEDVRPRIFLMSE